MSYGYGFYNPLDVNRDGLVTKQDFAFLGARHGTMGAAAGSALFNMLDTNRNGIWDQFDIIPGPGVMPAAYPPPTYPSAYSPYPTYNSYSSFGPYF